MTDMKPTPSEHRMMVVPKFDIMMVGASLWFFGTFPLFGGLAELVDPAVAKVGKAMFIFSLLPFLAQYIRAAKSGAFTD